MLNRIAAAVLVFLTTSCATAPPRAPIAPVDPAAGDIVRFIERVMRDFPETPSLAVAVVRDGKTLHARGYGFRDIEANARAGADTAYYIASSTKSYVGLLAAVLAGRGTVDLDTPVTHYVPELQLPDGVAPQRVTLRTLLTHTAGLSSGALVFRTAYSGEHSTPLLTDLVSRSRVGDPKFRYDNYGYVVASLVLERVTGRKWQDLLEEVIFRPAGMHHTTAYISRTASWPRAVPHAFHAGRLTRREMLKRDDTMHAAGGLMTTATDLARWVELNISHGRIGGAQVLPAAAFETAHRQQATLATQFGRYRRQGYGLGWYWSDYEGKTLLHHFGGFSGWRAHVSFMPESRDGVAVVTNTSGPAFEVPDLVADYIYDRLGDRPDLEVTYEARMRELRDSIEKDRLASEVELAKRAARPPTLRRDASAYVGKYRHPDWGTITVRQAGSDLVGSIARLEGKLEPFTEPDSARVEFVPGSGQVLRFEFGSDSRATAIKWQNDVFPRVD